MIEPCLNVDVNSFGSELCQELRNLKANNRGKQYDKYYFLN